MKESLFKTMRNGQFIDVMYMSKTGEVTKRRLKFLKLIGDSFQAYCFLRNTKRTILIDNVLALIPVVQKERNVI